MEQKKDILRISTKCTIISIVIYLILCIVSLFLINFDSNIWEKDWYGNSHIKYDTIRFNISVAKYYFGILPLVSAAPTLIFSILRLIWKTISLEESNTKNNIKNAISN